jgi:hypothetical protein
MKNPAYFGDIDIAAFEAGDISADDFTHEAHLFIGWSYLQQTDLQTGILRFTRALKRLTKKLGVPGKYHETISSFFMIILGERQRSSPPGSWPQFKDQNPDLFDGAKDVLSRYYTKGRLESDLAREQFLLPDRPLIG